MKKIILAALVAASFSVAASETHVIEGNVGSLQVAPCASVGPGASCEGNVQIDVNGGGDLIVNGEHTVIKGQDGKDGVDGKDGAQGQKGDKGDKGDTGANGKDGVNGKDGKDGLNGSDGKNGVDGKDGAKGDKGDKGDAGSNGLDGRDGKDGVDGLDGKDGKDGAKGDKGDAGKDGIDGSEYDDTQIKHSVSNVTNKVNQVNNRVDRLERDIKHNRKVASRGIAGAIAGSQIPQAVHAGGSLVGAGVGTYDGESAIAVGVSHRFDNDKWTVKATVAATDQSVSFGAGVGYEW